MPSIARHNTNSVIPSETRNNTIGDINFVWIYSARVILLSMGDILIIVGICICVVAVGVLIFFSRRNSVKQRELDKQVETTQQKLTVLEQQYEQIRKAMEQS